MRRRDNLLFYEGDLDAVLDFQKKQITEKVNAVHKDQFLATSEDDLVEHLFPDFHVEPLTIYEESMEMEQQEVKMDVSGDYNRNTFGDSGPINVQAIRVVVSVPFTGDVNLWKLRTNPYQSVFPRADVNGPIGDNAGSIDMEFQQPIDGSPEQIKMNLDSELKNIRFYVDNQRKQVERFNEIVPDQIRIAIRARQERLKKHDGVAGLLDIPLKRRGGTPSVEPIKIVRTLVKPLPPPPKSGYKAEPGITDKDYEHILSVIRHEGRTFETTPRTYAVHDEEELRDIILAHLNGHYQGSATGETFRGSGKTDIRIEDQDRAAFVAECKVWRGTKELLAAVDQLLSYLTWRDCKASIIIFNKHNAKFTELLEKVPEALKTHNNFKRDLGPQGAGEWRFVFTSTEDELRQVIVNVSIFNIYVAS